MISNLQSYKSYFESLATHLGCTFVYANKGRVLDKQLSQIIYPLLWVPVPEVRLNLEHGRQYIFQGAMVFLKNAPSDDYTAQDTALATMLTLATNGIAKLQIDAEDNFEFDPESVAMEHVAFWSADNDWGWKVEFEIGGSIIC
jgi:hypothetical protein